MFEKILVPLDGSQTAERALGIAQRLAPQELLLLRVPTAEEAFVEGEIAAVFPHEPQDERAVERAVAYLERIAERVAQPQMKIRLMTPEGDIAGKIVDTAEAEAVDLVLMSAHGRSALKIWMLGGVAERVMRNVRRPVLLTRSAELEGEMVVLLDGSALAEQILPLALTLAKQLDMGVELLNVSDPSKAAIATGYLQRIIERYGNPERVVPGVISGEVAAAIVGYMSVERLPLLAMVTHGYTGARRWAYGSVAEKVVRGADCSLLILRPSPP